MKIERVDDKTVKCFISNEEMAEYQITYKDFITRTEKAKEIVEEIIEQAQVEVGYKPPQFALDLQIMMMPERGMVLTFSEKMPDEIQNNPSLLEYLKDMKKMLTEKLGKLPKADANAQPASVEAPEAMPAPVVPAPMEEVPRHPDFAVFRFDSLRGIYDYVKVLPKNLRVISKLYVDKGTFYLYMHKGAASYKRYSQACIQALEFGALHSATEEFVSFLEEHAEELISEKAINRLRV